MKREENALREQTAGEEIANTVTHVIGSHLGAAMLALLVWAGVNSGVDVAWKVTCASIFGASVILLYAISSAYGAAGRRKGGFRTLEQAARHIAQYEPKGEFFSWLYVIMRNFRLMDLRKNEPEIIPVGAPQDLPEVPDAKLAEALSSVDKDAKDRGVLGRGLARVVLVAASVTLLLGFVPTVFERDDAGRDVRIVHFDEIRPSDPNRMPSDFQLNGLALFGFCREAIRRRVKPLVRCFCKRREEE